jgi:hypothetical protein
VAACKRETVAKRPQVCKDFVDGLLEGLKFVYLNPEKAIDIHIDSLKEFQGGAPATREVLFYGQEVGTSLGFIDAFKHHGLGYIDPALADVTRQSVITYMGIKGVPSADKLYTDQFAGGATLTPDEWTQVEARVKKELPSTVS